MIRAYPRKSAATYHSVNAKVLAKQLAFSIPELGPQIPIPRPETQDARLFIKEGQEYAARLRVSSEVSPLETAEVTVRINATTGTAQTMARVLL